MPPGVILLLLLGRRYVHLGVPSSPARGDATSASDHGRTSGGSLAKQASEPSSENTVGDAIAVALLAQDHGSDELLQVVGEVRGRHAGALGDLARTRRSDAKREEDGLLLITEPRGPSFLEVEVELIEQSLEGVFDVFLSNGLAALKMKPVLQQQAELLDVVGNASDTFDVPIERGWFDLSAIGASQSAFDKRGDRAGVQLFQEGTADHLIERALPLLGKDVTQQGQAAPAEQVGDPPLRIHRALEQGEDPFAQCGQRLQLIQGKQNGLAGFLGKAFGEVERRSQEFVLVRLLGTELQADPAHVLHASADLLEAFERSDDRPTDHVLPRGQELTRLAVSCLERIEHRLDDPVVEDLGTVKGKAVHVGGHHVVGELCADPLEQCRLAEAARRHNHVALCQSAGIPQQALLDLRPGNVVGILDSSPNPKSSV